MRTRPRGLGGAVILAAALAFLGTRAAAGQDPPEAPRTMTLTLKQCIALALQKGRAVEVARYVPWLQNETLLGAYGAFDTTFFASASSSSIAADTSTALLPTRQTAQEHAVGVRRLFPSGALAELRVSAVRQKNNLVFTTLSPSWSDRVGLTLTLPLLRGAGEDATTSTLRVGRIQRDMSVDEFETVLQEAVFAVQTAYYELVYAREAEAVAEESARVSEKLLEETRRRFEAGRVAELQVTEAEAQVAREALARIGARRAREDAVDRLARLIDPALLGSGRLDLVPLDRPQDPAEKTDVERAIAEGIASARDRRADLRRAARSEEAQKIVRDQAENLSRPRLDLALSGAYQAVDGTFIDAYHRLTTGDFYDVSAMVTLEIPLENRKALADLRAAELERRRLREARRDLADRVLLEIREAARAMGAQEEGIRSAQEQVRLAERRVASERARFEGEATTLFFVDEAQAALKQARLALLRARIDHSLARLGYRRATGTLLSEWGVAVDAELPPRGG